MRMQTVGNICGVLKGVKDIQLENRSVGEPGPGEVQIAIQRTGVCGSDVEAWLHGSFLGNSLNGTVLGHECSGIVSKTGSEVSNVKEGDRVALYPLDSCKTCVPCRRGNETICSNFRCLGLVNYPYGGLMQYIVHPANLVYRIPDNVTFEEGAMTEPLGVTLRACLKANLTSDDSLLVAGAGPIGLCTLLNAKAMGIQNVCVIDKDKQRLDFAVTMGVTSVYQITDGDLMGSVCEKIRDQMGTSPDHAIETSGFSFPINVCINVVQSGGSVILLGLAEENVKFPAITAVLREIKVEGSVGPEQRFPELLEMMAEGKINVKPLITHRFSLTESQKAFEVSESKAGLKVMINCAESESAKQ